LADPLALSLPVMQETLALLTRDGLCEIVAGEGQGPASYRYRLSGRGLERSAAAFERNSYIGQAPVVGWQNPIRIWTVDGMRHMDQP